MANPFTTKKKTRGSKPFKSKKVVDKTIPTSGVVGVAIPEPRETTNVWEARAIAKRATRAKESDKEDSTIDGVRICHVREHDGFWTIEVINGELTCRFDNRHGWLLDLGDHFKEPARWLKPLLIDRWYRELKRQNRSAPHFGIDHFPVIEKKPTKAAAKNGDEPAPKKRGRPKGSKNKKNPNPFTTKKGR